MAVVETSPQAAGVERGDATAGGNGASGTTALGFCRSTSVRSVANRHCCWHLSASLFLYLPDLSECRKRKSPASSMAKVLVFVAGTNVVHVITAFKIGIGWWRRTQRSLWFETVKLPSLELRGLRWHSKILANNYVFETGTTQTLGGYHVLAGIWLYLQLKIR